MRKKGSLSLSITAIVVIVIAFVVLGLGLSLTRTIFKGAEQKLPEAFAVTQLEAEPTAANPITIAQTVEIGRGDSETMQVGFFNRKEASAYAARFILKSCLTTGQVPVLDSDLPIIASISQDVHQSDSAGYSIIMTENDKLSLGTYICTISVEYDGTTTLPPGVSQPTESYETKQFFLKVVP